MKLISLPIITAVCILISSTLPCTANQGDTTVVQTLQFSDITKRRGWYTFPSDTTQFEKILMYYTLKCDPQTTQDGYDCGEWDYTTYTNLYEHTGVLDSNVLTYPNFYVSGNSPDTFGFDVFPNYTYYQSWQYETVIDSTFSETPCQPDSGAISNSPFLSSNKTTGKTQFLWKANELINAGLAADTIKQLHLNLTTTSAVNYKNLIIRLKNSVLTELNTTSYELTGLTEVYNYTTSINSGINKFIFTAPFIWDGTSNLVVEMCYTNSTNTAVEPYAMGDTVSYNCSVFSESDQQYLDYDWGDYVDIPATAFANIDSFVTLAFWQYGDPNVLPANTYIFEGIDQENNRVVNCHLPWSNSRVYWDAGNESGYDRIDKAANTSDFAGQWNHWAFTKNASTGEMKIYLNGVLWHSGSGMTKTMTGITQFKIAARGDLFGRYDGFIDDFQVWNIELDQNTIADWLYKDIDATHPNYMNLQAYYRFEEGTGTSISDASPYNHTATMVGLPQWQKANGCDVFTNLSESQLRPNLIFVQGNYQSHIDSTLVIDSIQNAATTLLEFNDTTIIPIPSDTTQVWPEGYAYTYDQNGLAIDSVYTNPLITLYNYDMNYWGVPFEVINTVQLQNYVTPYGIGLDLGPNGFRWVYDVTDYEPWLHDSVELSAGNQQELIDLKFIFIEGTPTRNVIDAEVIWNGDYGHANIANDVSMPAVNIDLNPNATGFVVRTRTTGHWFGGFENCAEFCPKLHHLKIDGTKQFEWMNWTTCGNNPVFPQGGTWIYDRAGWCPGAFADTYNHELTPFVNPGANVSIDYGMEITAGGMEGNYRTAVQLFQYDSINFITDAAVEEVIAPNSWEFHNKANPICGEPIIRIKNKGSNTLNSVDISYGVLGGTTQTYSWNGSLAFEETEVVTLPSMGVNAWVGSQTFEVNLSNPNGTQDQNTPNNTYKSNFDLVPQYADTLSLWVQTNNAGHETSWRVEDIDGNILYQSGTLASNTTYNYPFPIGSPVDDTLIFEPGCYTLYITDTDCDGFSFWANNDGSGAFRIIRLRGEDNFAVLNSFDGDFGCEIKHPFMVGYEHGQVDVHEKVISSSLNVYPNPARNTVNVDLKLANAERAVLQIHSTLGQLVYEQSLTSEPWQGLKIDFHNQPSGIYFVSLKAESHSIRKKLLILK